LKAFAELAENEQLDAIYGASLCRQRKELQAARKEHLLNTLTEDHRMLYRIVKQKGRILSGDLWQEYLWRCRKIKRKPLAPRTFSEYASRLVQAGLITSERARVRGKVRLFKARA
jgi:Cdc6-like AAA superfamily ATPase